jgi:hypothetical protein
MSVEADVELRRLVRQQARDDALPRLEPRAREVREADLTPGRRREGRRARIDDLAVDHWVMDPELLRPRVMIGFTATWTAAVIGYHPHAGQVCPGCGDARAPRRWPMMDREERAKLLAGPAPLVARVEQVRTRRQRRKLVMA